MKYDNQIITCSDQKELDDKRNSFKALAKREGQFLRVEQNTVVLKGGKAVTFVLDESLDLDDETMEG